MICAVIVIHCCFNWHSVGFSFVCFLTTHFGAHEQVDKQWNRGDHAPLRKHRYQQVQLKHGCYENDAM